MKIAEIKKQNGDTVYRAKVYLGVDKLTGKKIKANLTARTKTELKKKAQLAKAEFQNNGSTKKETIPLTSYEEVAQLWWESYQHTVKPNTPNAAASANPSHCLRDKTAKVRNRYRANSQPKSKIAAVKKRSIPPVRGGSACPNIRPIGQDAPQNAAMPNSFRWIAKCFIITING